MSGTLLRPGYRGEPPTPRQREILTFWAPCTTDATVPWLAGQHGTPPNITERTATILDTRGWAFVAPGTGGLVWIVTDRGRAAVRQDPVGRDRACPVCGAVRGGRCYDMRNGGTPTYRVHQERTGGTDVPIQIEAVPVRLAPGAPKIAWDPEMPIGMITAT